MMGFALLNPSYSVAMKGRGRREASGSVAALYDPTSGKIDRAEAENYRKYDIHELLKNDPQKFGPIFKQRGHLDTYG